MARSTYVCAIILFTSLLGAGCNKGELKEVETPKPESSRSSLQVGDEAPAWTDLAGIDDAKHSLSDLEDTQAVAVVFTCNHCPVAKAYEDRLVQLSKDYADKSFKLVAINVNNLEEDKLPAMKQRAEEKGFNFPYLYDPSQEIGRDYAATVTPHAFLLDTDRKVVYMGAIDDSQSVEKVEKQYLRDAIDAVLAGENLAVSSSKQFGCSIKYE